MLCIDLHRRLDSTVYRLQAHKIILRCRTILRSRAFPFQEPYMSAKVANRSNFSRQLKETSGIGAYTARPTTEEAASPWQAMSV